MGNRWQRVKRAWGFDYRIIQPCGCEESRRTIDGVPMSDRLVCGQHAEDVGGVGWKLTVLKRKDDAPR